MPKKNADFHNPSMAVKTQQGDWVVMVRNAKIAVYTMILDVSVKNILLVYGAKIKVKDGGKVEIGQKFVEWDPYSLTILTEVGGKVRFRVILLKGVTMKDEVDEVTGLSRKCCD